MCPVTPARLLPSWRADERHRNAGFLPTGVCRARPPEGRTVGGENDRNDGTAKSPLEVSVSLSPGKKPPLKVFQASGEERKKEERRKKRRRKASFQVHCNLLLWSNQNVSRLFEGPAPDRRKLNTEVTTTYRRG